MCSDNLKRQMSYKHGNVNNTLHQSECYLAFRMITNDALHNNESIAGSCKVEELDDSLVTYTANLKSKLRNFSKPASICLIFESALFSNLPHSAPILNLQQSSSLSNMSHSASCSKPASFLLSLKSTEIYFMLKPCLILKSALIHCTGWQVTQDGRTLL